VQVNVSARHGQLAQQTKDKMVAKVEKLQRFYERVTSIQVTADLESKDAPNVEIRVTAERAEDFVATDQGDLIGALESCIQKIEHQLRKHKEKHSDHRAASIKHMEVPENDGTQ
tara:strand:+ start:176 stop:517 length:342 start_codon:yes stop_codon:yes gene_type:complete